MLFSVYLLAIGFRLPLDQCCLLFISWPTVSGCLLVVLPEGDVEREGAILNQSMLLIVSLMANRFLSAFVVLSPSSSAERRYAMLYDLRNLPTIECPWPPLCPGPTSARR